MNVKQMCLDLDVPETKRDVSRNAFIAKALVQDSTGRIRLLESIMERENMVRALNKVIANKGAPGVDGMRCRDLRAFVKRTWPAVKEALQKGVYQPLPVRKKEISKPDGGTRMLGIPAVHDRFVQQAIAQVMTAIYDHTFSESSFGYRPGRSQSQAVEQYRKYVEDGYTYVVSIDLSKFFDRVNHHRLLSRLESRIKDRRVIKLIRSFLKSGMQLDDYVIEYAEEGTPQGGPLSPLLSNVVLDELDKELERRGHRFVRYADDIVIVVQSQRAAQRVLASVSRYISNRLKLKVNAQKSCVARPWEVKFLGFKVTKMFGATRSVTHPKTVARFKDKVRLITKRNRRVNIRLVIYELNQLIRGWRPIYASGLSGKLKKELNRWIIRRLKVYLLKQWRKPKTRFKKLRRLGLSRDEAYKVANTRRGTWHTSGTYLLNFAMPQQLFTQRGKLLLFY